MLKVKLYEIDYGIQRYSIIETRVLPIFTIVIYNRNEIPTSKHA